MMITEPALQGIASRLYRGAVRSLGHRDPALL